MTASQHASPVSFACSHLLDDLMPSFTAQVELLCWLTKYFLGEESVTQMELNVRGGNFYDAYNPMPFWLMDYEILKRFLRHVGSMQRPLFVCKVKSGTLAPASEGILLLIPFLLATCPKFSAEPAGKCFSSKIQVATCACLLCVHGSSFCPLVLVSFKVCRVSTAFSAFKAG